MNKKKQSLTLVGISLVPCALCLVPSFAHAAARINNQSRSYANAYNQVMTMSQQAEYLEQQAAVATTPEALPVRVANADLANRIAHGDTSVGVDKTGLESCSMIYPNGNFAWDIPTAGAGVGGTATCVGVVELRAITGGTDYTVVARANVAAGDAVKCNISDFPEATYTNDAYNVTFPWDTEPTMDDVIKTMNAEQKKNAGFKIAAGVLVGGLAGNAAGKNEPGKTGVLGGGKSKTNSALVGALSGGALMAGSSYAGKVGGDVILSTGVNAAAGGIVGNMVASGESVLRIEDCEVDGSKTTCLWGIIEKSTPIKETETAYYNISDAKTIVCNNINDKKENCREERIIGISFGTDANSYKSVEAGVADNWLRVHNDANKKFSYDPEKRIVTPGHSTDPNGIWTPIETGGRPAGRAAAMIPDFKDKAFGVKMTDWHKWRGDEYNTANIKIVGRDTAGNSTGVQKDAGWTVKDFYPLTVDAEDGGMIDISNKARAKGTLIGAGAGGALGAFTAYQGATEEVDARWISAVTEYKDSLQKFYCATGTRFLSHYNDLAIIPNMQ